MSKVVKNTAYLTGAFIAQKLLSFVYFSIIARLVGVGNIGAYSFALGYTTLFASFIDFGLVQVLIRQTARCFKNTEGLLNSILGIKIITSLLTLGSAIVSIYFVESSSLIRLLVYLAAMVMVIDSFTVTFWGVFRGRQTLVYEAAGVVISQFIILIVGISGLVLGVDLYILLIALIVGSLFNCLFSVYLIKKRLKLNLKPVFLWIAAKPILILALPFGILAVFSRFFMSMDTVLLKFMGGGMGKIYVGWYSVPYKINTALQFIPSAFGAVIFPAMSRYFSFDKVALLNLFNKSMRLLMIIAVPASVGIISLSDVIILKIYGVGYDQSIWPLRILSVGMVFVFLGFPVGALLNACNRQINNTINVGVVLLFSVILNIIFIPFYFHLAAASVAVFSNALLLALGLFQVTKIIPYSKRYLLLTFLKTVCCALVMALAVVLLKPYFFDTQDSLRVAAGLVVLPILGTAVYLLMMWFAGGWESNDWVILKKVFNKKKQVII